jgi:dienelactone hydrolase
VAAVTFFSLTCSAGETLKFDSLDPAHPYSVSGELFLPPKATGAVPAMVVIHGSGGKDERTEFFAEELPRHGIAAFVVDYKTGIFRNPSDRPPNDTFIAATYAALKLLQSRSEIIAEKIGVMGFSLGGQQTLSATLPKFKRMWVGDDAPRFRVHVAFYPGCKFYARKLSSDISIQAPIQVFWGTSDAYGDGEFCPKLKEQLANISSGELDFVAFDGAHHGFDGSKIGHFTDPAAINKDGYIQGSPGYRDQARSQELEFIEKNIK